MYACGRVCTCMKDRLKLSFDSQFPPSRDKVSDNETLSCCAEDTVGPPRDEGDLKDLIQTHTCACLYNFNKLKSQYLVSPLVLNPHERS